MKCQKTRSAPRSHRRGLVWVGGEPGDGFDESVDIAWPDCQATVCLSDRVGGFAVSRTDEDRRPRRGHHAVELAGNHNPSHLRAH